MSKSTQVEGERIIENKRLLGFAIGAFVISMFLNIPFPHQYPLGEAIFSALNVPVRFGSGFHTVGILSIILMFIGVGLLIESLNKYHGRLVILVILCLVFLPRILVGVYQETFASGIYSVSYAKEESECIFEMADEDTLIGECEIPLINHSNEDISVTLEFKEDSLFSNDIPFVTLMNVNGPFEILLKAEESKRAKLTAIIDVSEMERHVENGSAYGMDIAITEDGKHRDL